MIIDSEILTNIVIVGFVVAGFLLFLATYLELLINPPEIIILDLHLYNRIAKWIFILICVVSILAFILTGIELDSAVEILFVLPLCLAFLIFSTLALRVTTLYRFDLHNASCLVHCLRGKFRIDNKSASSADEAMKQRETFYRFLFYCRGTSIKEIREKVFPEDYSTEMQSNTEI